MLETLPAALPTLHARLGDPRLLAEMIVDANALVEGHFELLGGDHSDRFVRFSRIADDGARLDTLAEWFIPTIAAWLPTAALAPSTAGVALAATIARRLELPLYLAAVDGDGRATHVHDGAGLAGARVLLVNDVVTTGRGIEALAVAARETGATIAGAAWFVSRSNVDVARLIYSPVAALAELDLPSWRADACPLCDRHETLTHAVEVN